MEDAIRGLNAIKKTPNLQMILIQHNGESIYGIALPHEYIRFA